MKKTKKEFPPKSCRECGKKNVYYNKRYDRVYCRDCGAIMTR